MVSWDDVFIILGPTASGKTQWITPLLQRGGFHLVGCDSVHLYRELVIGSTRPTDVELQNVTYSCIGTQSIAAKLDAASYRQQAIAETDRALKCRQKVLVTGGSAFYFLAVTEGLAPVTNQEVHVRTQLQEEYVSDPEKLYRELLTRDPELEKSIHQNDQYRVIRALEVMRTTEMPWSEWQRKRVSYTPWKNAPLFILKWDAAELRLRIRERTQMMLQQGWIEEVEALLKNGFSPQCPGLRTVGYAQVVDFLLKRPQQSKEDLVSAVELATWQMARKQMTFFRSLARRYPITWVHGPWAATAQGQKWLEDLYDCGRADEASALLDQVF